MKIELECAEIYPIYLIEQITEHCSSNAIYEIPNDLLKKWIKVFKEFEAVQLEIVRYTNIPIDKNDLAELTDLELKEIE